MDNQALHLWELASGQEYLPIQPAETGKSQTFLRMCFSPDGRTFVTAREDRVIQLWDVVTGKELLRRAGYGSDIWHIAFAPDGKSLATGHGDSTILVWDVSAATNRSLKSNQPLTKEELESCWNDLSADARKAHVAIWKLVARPEEAVPLLRDRLQPASAPPMEQVRQLVTDLDSDKFAIREAVTKQLADFEELAEPALNDGLKGNPTLEKRRRIEALLAAPYIVRSPEKLRHLRAVQILEQIGDDAAKQVLKKLSEGAPEARLTITAKAALLRLSKQ